MIISMFLAHLVGDYIFQWESLAIWKSKALKGVFAHSLIILAVTWLFALPFERGWWPWVLFIWGVHMLIDALPVLVARRWPNLAKSGRAAMWRLIIDQVAHLVTILLALVGSGYLAVPTLAGDLLAALDSHRTLAYVLGYVAISRPGWVVIKFLAFGLVSDTPPDLSKGADKYVGILERGLITTFVLLGQFVLVPLVTIPRLVFEGPQVHGRQQRTVYVVELLVSVALAMAVGLALRQL